MFRPLMQIPSATQILKQLSVSFTRWDARDITKRRVALPFTHLNIIQILSIDQVGNIILI